MNDIRTVILTAAILTTFAVPALAGDNGFKAVWFEGGVTPGNKAAGSIAMGIKFHPNAAVVIGYSDDKDYSGEEVADMMPFTEPVGVTKSTFVGRKQINGSFGFDIQYHVNPLPGFSLYAGPGIYYREYRDVYRIDEGVNPISSSFLHPEALYSKTSEKRVGLAGGGGIQLQLYKGEQYGLVLTAGFHTIRGITGGIGMSW